MSVATLPRVMVASDDAFELTTMSASLRLHGVHVVAEASNRAIAENTFRSLQPDVLIIDLLFANAEAISLINAFRKINPELGIVLMTACPDMRLLGIAEKAIAHGVQIVLKRSVADLTVLSFAITYLTRAISELLKPCATRRKVATWISVNSLSTEMKAFSCRDTWLFTH